MLSEQTDRLQRLSTSKYDVFGKEMTRERFRFQMLSRWLPDSQEAAVARGNILKVLPDVTDQYAAAWLNQIEKLLANINESGGTPINWALAFRDNKLVGVVEKPSVFPDWSVKASIETIGTNVKNRNDKERKLIAKQFARDWNGDEKTLTIHIVRGTNVNSFKPRRNPLKEVRTALVAEFGEEMTSLSTLYANQTTLDSLQTMISLLLGHNARLGKKPAASTQIVGPDDIDDEQSNDIEYEPTAITQIAGSRDIYLEKLPDGMKIQAIMRGDPRALMNIGPEGLYEFNERKPRVHAYQTYKLTK